MSKIAIFAIPFAFNPPTDGGVSLVRSP